MSSVLFDSASSRSFFKAALRSSRTLLSHMPTPVRYAARAFKWPATGPVRKTNTMPSSSLMLNCPCTAAKYRKAPVRMNRTPSVALLVAACDRRYTSGRRMRPKALNRLMMAPNSTMRPDAADQKSFILHHRSSLDVSRKSRRADEGDDSDDQNDVEVGRRSLQHPQHGDHRQQQDADRIQRGDPVRYRRTLEQPVHAAGRSQGQQRQRDFKHRVHHVLVTSMIAFSKVLRICSFSCSASPISMAWIYSTRLSSDTSSVSVPGVRQMRQASRVSSQLVFSSVSIATMPGRMSSRGFTI
ncbi:hypothetical protein BN871_AC_00140 [Paenibacillus sp. P22]|nr:hypothetical protein BN871_AC_00140 [Paenibacillus sp. P22]